MIAHRERGKSTNRRRPLTLSNLYCAASATECHPHLPRPKKLGSWGSAIRAQGPLHADTPAADLAGL